MFLFDSGSTGTGAAYGGTGLKFNWEALQKAQLHKPFMLSGGIGPDDVAAVKAFAQIQKDMFAVDVNSKFELSPGIKDMSLVKQFLTELNA
jgi:phosphoribosylanthranilate isomerase